MAAAPDWLSRLTNLQAALDEVKGHHGRVGEPTAQDAPKATHRIVLIGAKCAAHIVCSKGEDTHMHTCRVTCGPITELEPHKRRSHGDDSSLMISSDTSMPPSLG